VNAPVKVRHMPVLAKRIMITLEIEGHLFILTREQAGALRARLTEAELGLPPSNIQDTIMRAVVDHFEITIAALCGRSRKEPLVSQRAIAMWLMRKLARLPLEQVAKLFGNRDHGTAIAACRKVDALILTEPKWAAAAAGLEMAIMHMLSDGPVAGIKKG